MTTQNVDKGSKEQVSWIYVSISRVILILIDITFLTKTPRKKLIANGLIKTRINDTYILRKQQMKRRLWPLRSLRWEMEVRSGLEKALHHKEASTTLGEGSDTCLCGRMSTAPGPPPTNWRWESAAVFLSHIKYFTSDINVKKCFKGKPSRLKEIGQYGCRSSFSWILQMQIVFILTFVATDRL